MTTLPPPATKLFPEDSLEKKCYNIAESLKEYIPIMNERYRLGFNLYRYMKGEGDPPEVFIKTAKIKFEHISREELIEKINNSIKSLST
ncbi:MAG: hypothetical protein QHH13_06495 [Melioribacter sp.]|uniref:hypothetical protein n=1 Tax=Rosettibacter primus TaxID=3111523 RepID=UPI00247C02B0|nr:hypothetical protein [Melioribacter sp.]